MSTTNNLNVDSEFRYIIQWFNEWSELQRNDFISVLVEYLKKNDSDVYINGIITGLSNTVCDDKPMSLFQCRVKLFKEWSNKWPGTFKEQLMEKLCEIDPIFERNLQMELDSSKNLTNGTTSPSIILQQSVTTAGTGGGVEQSHIDTQQQQQVQNSEALVLA